MIFPAELVDSLSISVVASRLCLNFQVSNAVAGGCLRTFQLLYSSCQFLDDARALITVIWTAKTFVAFVKSKLKTIKISFSTLCSFTSLGKFKPPFLAFCVWYNTRLI